MAARRHYREVYLCGCLADLWVKVSGKKRERRWRYCPQHDRRHLPGGTPERHLVSGEQTSLW